MIVKTNRDSRGCHTLDNFHHQGQEQGARPWYEQASHSEVHYCKTMIKELSVPQFNKAQVCGVQCNVVQLISLDRLENLSPSRTEKWSKVCYTVHFQMNTYEHFILSLIKAKSDFCGFIAMIMMAGHSGMLMKTLVGGSRPLATDPSVWICTTM